MIEFCYKSGNKNLYKYIAQNYPFLSYAAFKKLLRNKDIKINGKRIKEEIELSEGDFVQIYFEQKKQDIELEIVFEDDNIVAVFKPKGILSSGEGNTVQAVLEQKYELIKAVHRLDRNTEGVLLFAKSEAAAQCLLEASKQSQLKKYYTARVYGTMPKAEDTLLGYHFKESKKSIAYISDVAKKGYQKIQTSYKVLDINNNTSLLEIIIYSGKTHQIRAHLSHQGCFVLGDGKYGKNQINKLYGFDSQCLCAYKIDFLRLEGKLKYLSGQTIQAKPNSWSLQH